jgi:hypothetical protein
MIPVPTERPDADAPVPPVGTEQAAAGQAPLQQPPPAAESSPAEKIGDVADIVGDVTYVIGGIILSLLDD